MKKSGILLLVIFFLVSFLGTFVEGSLLGVNKIDLVYTDLLRGGYAEDSVVVSTGSERNISVYFEAQGNIKDWVSFKENQPMTMNSNNPSLINVIIQPPTDAAVGDYEGILLISTGPLGQQEGQMGTNVVVAFEVKIKVKITDTQILSCTAGGFNIKDFEIGNSLDLDAVVNNNGNVRATPDFKIVIYDQEQKKVVANLSYKSNKEIFPTMSSQINAKLENNLNEGQYWTEISSPLCNSASFLTFSVLEKGGISDVGEFVRLKNDAWAKTGDIVPLLAQFKNRGSREVSAQFKGVASLDGKIVKVLSSDKVDVGPGELVNLEVFFTPVEVGQYKLTGRINYNNKLTFEKSSILNVEQGTTVSKGNNANIYYIALLIIILLIILFLILIIRKKKIKGRK